MVAKDRSGDGGIESVYVVGAGGLGRETYDALLARGDPVRAFVDEKVTGGDVRGRPVVAVSAADPGTGYVIGIADPDTRRRLATALDARGLHPVSVVHPRAVVGPDTSLGDGCIVLANAHVSSSITIGMHCNVQYNATIGHDSVLEDYVSVFPGANVSGSVVVESGATIGSNAVVLQGLSVGAGAFVGAGAVVTKSVPPGAVVVGSPARPIRS